LFVVATPIGNLEDITLRALRILREVTLVAAEDTRRTGNLLRHYQISTPLLSYHAHNERQRAAEILEHLQAGHSVALVSDAGTPGISDPGATLVTAAREAGIRVDPIPGPSAVTAALSAAGLTLERFAFAGFPPFRSKDRKRWVDWIRALPDTVVVCFEAPHRIRRTMDYLSHELVNRPIILARELTKAHEQWLFGDRQPTERGEFVIIIGQTTKSTETAAGRSQETVGGGLQSLARGVEDGHGQHLQSVEDVRVAAIFGELTESGQFTSRRAAIRATAERLHLPTKTVYDALERAKT
jgi:16S rRNA (cytidine1402-2'-O)-methyltransferase